jgi:hypothetical protein
MITGRPVKMLWTREEVFYAHRGRHPMHMRYRTGAKRDGRIRGVDAKILIDGGAYSSFGLVTAYYAGQLLTGPYDFPSYRFDSTRVFTNKPPCGPKRGHGSVQPRFAFEVQLDQVAEKLGLDPIEIRRKNVQGENTKTVNGQRITSNGFLQCLDEVERASGWKTRHGKLPRGRGLGVAGSMYISGTNYPVYPNPLPQAGIQLAIERSGRVTVFTGGNDIGQGRTRSWRPGGRRAGHSSRTCASSPPTPILLTSISARTPAVSRSWSATRIDACRKLRADVKPSPRNGRSRETRALIEARVSISGSLSLDATAEEFQIAGALRHVGSTGAYNTPTRGGDYRNGTIGARPRTRSLHMSSSVDVETGRIT